MTSTRWPPLAERLAHLADSFQQLKERVRDAVATELGKVVADAVRDWITSALQARMPTRFQSGEPAFMPTRDADGWDDTDPWHEAEPFDQSIADPPPEPKVSSCAAALSLGFVAAKWLIARRLPFMPSIGAGVLLGTFALVGGPLVQASLAAATAAADLAAIARAEPRPPN